MTWECIERPTKFFFVGHAAHGVSEFKRVWGTPFPTWFMSFHGEIIVWCWNQEELNQTGEKLFQRFGREPDLGQKMRKKWFENKKKLEKTFKQFEKKSVLEWNNQNLGLFAEKMLGPAAVNWAIGGIWDLFDLVLETKIKNELSLTLDHEKNKGAFQRAFVALTTPPEESFAKTEERELVKIAVAIRERPRQKKLFFGETKKIKRELKRFLALEKKIYGHLERFFWIRAGYSSGKRLSLEEILERLKEAVQKKAVPLKKTNPKKIAIEKKRILKKISGSRELERAVCIIDELGFLHDAKKELQMRYFVYSEDLLSEAAKRLRVQKNLAYFFTPHELAQALKTGQANRETLKKRVQNVAFEKIEPEKLLAASEAVEFEARVLGKKNLDLAGLREVSGTGANPGTAIGKARIIKSLKELTQMQQGEILITGMTTPDFVPAMKKAVGIVTDEGGVLCHAAIASRELKLPCVVGTKTATKVFKTGETIEVRANHGVVRKVSA